MEQRELPVTWARHLAIATDPHEAYQAPEASAVLTRLEDCLVDLDAIGWSMQAAQLSQAIDSLRHRLQTRLGLALTIEGI